MTAPQLPANLGKPSICLFVTSLESGGAERQVVNLACALAKREQNVRVVCLRLYGKFGHYRPTLEANKVTVTAISLKDIYLGTKMSLKNYKLYSATFKQIPLMLLPFVFGVYGNILHNPPQILHCFLDFNNIIGGFAAFFAKIPFRMSFRNLTPIHFKFYEKWMLPSYQYLLNCSQPKLEANSRAGQTDYAQWLNRDDIAYVPNGISLDPNINPTAIATLRLELQLPPESLIVSFIGRLSPEKRPEDVIKIAAKVCKQLPQAVFLLVGIGSLDLKSAIATHGLQAKVKLLGRRQDITSILAITHTLVLTSAQEGMPNVIMEGMRQKIPCVATPVGGIPDLLGNTGFMHPVGDIDSFANSIIQLLTNPSLCLELGQAAQARLAQNFSLDKLVQTTLTNYNDMLKTREHSCAE